ncbi:MAG TPA: class I SAM-dependent methyltransferase [Gemmatimonadaceae bacterium]
MKQVDYDSIAPAFDRRYEQQRWASLEAVLRRFLAGCEDAAVGEVGCGTGHWLALFEGMAGEVFGIDLSWGMLAEAKRAVPRAHLARATAQQLPWRDASMSRVFCVNALHHFPSPERFFRECRRVLRPGGSFLTIALDPHTGTDAWWVYDYFPGALATDRERYLSTGRIRELLSREGFAGPATTVAQHIAAAVPFGVARARGLVDRRSTSQLLLVSDAEFADGVKRLEREQPLLTTDLRLFATTATVPARDS